MNEAERRFQEFEYAFAHLEELKRQMAFLQCEAEIYGDGSTLGEARKRMNDEYCSMLRRMEDYFKEKENVK